MCHRPRAHENTYFCPFFCDQRMEQSTIIRESVFEQAAKELSRHNVLGWEIACVQLLFGDAALPRCVLSLSFWALSWGHVFSTPAADADVHQRTFCRHSFRIVCWSGERVRLWRATLTSTGIRFAEIRAESFFSHCWLVEHVRLWRAMCCRVCFVAEIPGAEL